MEVDKVGPGLLASPFLRGELDDEAMAFAKKELHMRRRVSTDRPSVNKNGSKLKTISN